MSLSYGPKKGLIELVDYINEIRNLYDEYAMDHAHSGRHINRVIQNVILYYPELSPAIKDVCEKEFVVLVGLYHDIGLLNIPGTHWTCFEEARLSHHIRGRDIFLAHYHEGKFKQFPFVTAANIELGANAILNHRSSMKSTKELDVFIKTCDNLCPAEEYMLRTIQFVSSHYPDASDFERGVLVINHITKKYIGNNAYADVSHYPIWARELISKEIDRLKFIIDSYYTSKDARHDWFDYVATRVRA